MTHQTDVSRREFLKKSAQTGGSRGKGTMAAFEGKMETRDVRICSHIYRL
jgi:hypothetical protein